MIKHYQHKDRILVAVDCIIFAFNQAELQLLLAKRAFHPKMGAWSLIGGFVRVDESLDDAATRILNDLTGLDNIYMEQVSTFSNVNRDPVERTISIAYYALIKMDKSLELKKEYGARWFPISDLPELVFDHMNMVIEAHEILKSHAKHHPIGFELLQKKFTIPQLRQLYEAIYGRALDKRNFSRKIHAMRILHKLDEKEKLSSRKGAFFYEFDKKRYEELVSQGFNFVM